ncbi:uncharacterized protein L201_005490 [Kwoniella dendrophila CBS 6074]|uniref:Uncharacterized protein n=1 Tax=Kwoniella dendrophila CBS 6074 TaxID=1295534 RepID=A0AAX4JZD0_9TREE
MLFLQAISILALLGLNTIKAFPAPTPAPSLDEGILTRELYERGGELKFKIEFEEDAGYRKTNKDFTLINFNDKIKKDTTIQFTWNKKDLGTDSDLAKSYFKFYAYNKDNLNDKPYAEFNCTLSGKKLPKDTAFSDILSNKYTLIGNYDQSWRFLSSTFQRQIAHLYCIEFKYEDDHSYTRKIDSDDLPTKIKDVFTDNTKSPVFVGATTR